MKYLQYHLKRNIKNVSLVVIFLTLWNTSYTQTETQYYESFFTNTNLEKILEEQRDSLLKMFNENDKTLINSIQMEIVNSKDIRLIESSYNNNVRKITISNTFLRTLAKISDAFHIEGTIDKSKHTYEYLDFCVENSDTTILGPATFYKLNPNNIQQYVSSQSINGRIALYFLSLRFILLHEYAHHLKGHLENNITNEKSKVDQEIEADNYAMKYFSDLGWPPALISQMMYFFYKLDNSENITDNEFSHPTGLERTSSLISNSLMHLEETYKKMSSLAPIIMSYDDFYTLIYDGGIQIYGELLDDMNQDYDTYLELADNKNIAAQIKMGMMYYRGTNGWKKNENEGLKWLKKSSKKSDLGALILGMTYEYKGDLSGAIEAYKLSAKKGNYYAEELLGDLEKWQLNNPSHYEILMLHHLKKMYDGCMSSCQTKYKNSEVDCRDDFCNTSVVSMHYRLMHFRHLVSPEK